jgi:mannose/fructose/N-acetylgalactosamine-specific phosphotransferase system component IIB
MSFFPGKKRIFETVSVDEEDVKAFCKLISKGISVKYQASPSDIGLDMVDYV